jgi:hypothetical protein
MNNYPPLPPEPIDDMMTWLVPYPLALYEGGILKVPIRELNQVTFILTKNICGLHLSNNRIYIQTSIPCQGKLSHIALACVPALRDPIVKFVLRIMEYNKKNGV